MFGRIARRYDVANRLLSGGMDLWWRNRFVKNVRRIKPNKILDLATGSGDVAFALSRALPPGAEVVGMDFCLPMLAEAERKKAAAETSDYLNLSFLPGDGLALPLSSGSFDAVTISFGLRNLADRARGLGEMHRVLRPGGKLFVLEFSRPYRWFQPFYFFYLRKILPRLAGAVTGDRAAYVYLNDSIEQFPDRESLSQELEGAGFIAVTATAMSLGIVALHEGTKPNPRSSSRPTL